MLASNLPKSPFFPTHYVPISCSFHITRNFSQLQTAAEEAVNGRVSERNEISLGLPSKGHMAADTIDLLKDCQLPIKHVNPRQYVAQIPQGFHFAESFRSSPLPYQFRPNFRIFRYD
ncbi:hypothetical protein ACFX12_013987 [Malus domestica]